MAKHLVVIDPGHLAGENKGVIEGYYEGDQVWKISRHFLTELEKYDVAVLCTKQHIKDNTFNAYQRGIFAANQTGYETVTFLSLHTNWYGDDNGVPIPSAVGTVLFRSLHRPETQALGDKIAKDIATIINKYSGITYSRGCLAWDRTQKEQYKNYPKGYDYHDVTRGSMLNAGNAEQAKKSNINYGYIIEFGFHSNPDECKALMNEQLHKEVSVKTIDTLADHFKWQRKQGKEEPLVINETFKKGEEVRPIKNITTVNGVKRGRLFGAVGTYAIYLDKYYAYRDTEASGRTVIADNKGTIIAATYAEDLERVSAPTPSPAPAPAPVPKPTSPFPDVAPDAWYAQMIAELKAAGIVNGYPDGTVKPEVEAKRAEMFTVDYKLLKKIEELEKKVEKLEKMMQSN